MTMHRDTRAHRAVHELFAELADARTPAYLEAAIEHASSRAQRPAWTYPGRWLPVDITGPVSVAPGRWARLGAVALILLLAVAAVAYVGSQPTRPIFTTTLSNVRGNGVIALAKDGDILVADRPGSATRPLVAGPEHDEQPTFSPDGTKLAFLRMTDPRRYRWALMVADADGANIVQVTPELEDLGGWSFAPDSRSLLAVAVIAEQKRVVIYPVDRAAAPIVLDVRLPDAWMNIEPPRFRPTNPREILVVAQPDPDGPRGIYVYDLVTGGIRTIAEPAAPRDLTDVAWSPSGEHIIYGLWDGRSNGAHVAAADGSGDRALDLPGERVSPWSNDGTRVVLFRGGEGAATAHPAVVTMSGTEDPVELACGPRSNVECAPSWIWSPDDSMLIGTSYHETSSSGEDPLTATYVLAEADTGRVTDLGWEGDGPPSWQRVAP